MSTPERILWTLAVLIGLALILISWPAKAHSWFPPTCCTSIDCFEVKPGKDIVVFPGGYLVVATNEFIPTERTRETPPAGRDHWARCTRGGDRSARTLGNDPDGYAGDPRACLFVPPARF